jgi:hypothetical protein
MMARRGTLFESRWPSEHDDVRCACDWANSIVKQVLGWLWHSFDQVFEAHLAEIDLTQRPEELERSLVVLHQDELQVIWGRETRGFSSFIPTHERPELESRSAPPARSPSYDLGFVCLANRRWCLPFEAKVLTGDGAIAEYLKDVRDKFESGVAAPFVSTGGMIGYLLVGSPDKFFQRLANELSQVLDSPEDFLSRAHRTSQHLRKSHPKLKLHHLVMELTRNEN